MVSNAGFCIGPEKQLYIKQTILMNHSFVLSKRAEAQLLYGFRVWMA
jgi:hypothetical protein